MLYLSASRPRKHLSKLATVGNGDLGLGGAAGGTVGLDLLDDVHTLNDLAEDDVLAIQPGGLLSADEELGSVAIDLSAIVARVLQDAGGLITCWDRRWPWRGYRGRCALG